jgi:hypothetical protein
VLVSSRPANGCGGMMSPFGAATKTNESARISSSAGVLVWGVGADRRCSVDSDGPPRAPGSMGAVVNRGPAFAVCFGVSLLVESFVVFWAKGYPHPGQATASGRTNLPQSGHLISGSIRNLQCGHTCALSLTRAPHSGQVVSISLPEVCPVVSFGTSSRDPLPDVSRCGTTMRHQDAATNRT